MCACCSAFIQCCCYLATDLQAVRYRARANWIGPEPDSVLRSVRSLLAEDESANRLQTGSSRLLLPQRPGSIVPRQRPPVCGGPRRSVVSSLGINEHTRRACDTPVNSRKPCVSGGRGSHVEQSASRCHFVAITVDIQETAEDRTVCLELSIAPATSDTLLFTARTSFRFFVFFVL